MPILYFATHIYCASLNYYVAIASPSPIHNVDYGHNVGIALWPHIQCAFLNYDVSIAFRVPTYNVD